MGQQKNSEDMLGRSALLERREAQRLFGDRLSRPALPFEEIDVRTSLGRIVCREITSPETLPPFARSTMDGFAVRARDTYGATESLPAYLNLVGEVLMGAAADHALGEMETVKIWTGGMLPEGADAVVMLEYAAAVDNKTIEAHRAVAPGENVIEAGEDVAMGTGLLTPGHRMRPQDIGALCGLGITRLAVCRRPRVAVIPTGNEIVPPDARPGPGQIRDINSHHLAALIKQDGCESVVYPVVPDEESRFEAVLKDALGEADVVLLSGGSSVGARDLTAQVVSGLGNPGVIFHGVAVKPGKPTIGAVVDGKPLFGLPGHPASVVIGYELFVRPLLQILAGVGDVSWEPFANRTRIRAKVGRRVASRPGREDYVRVALEEEGDQVVARPVLGKSGLITTLVHADGTVIIPANRLGLEQGDEVDVWLFA
ncbi:MAG: molybdopterin molybdotransferase MoeA [bacterium]|nr:molybdopterin molybdotransferase MoeA [bacterium]